MPLVVGTTQYCHPSPQKGHHFDKQSLEHFTENRSREEFDPCSQDLDSLVKTQFIALLGINTDSKLEAEATTQGSTQAEVEIEARVKAESFTGQEVEC